MQEVTIRSLEELINARKVLTVVDAADEAGILERLACGAASLDDLHETFSFQREALLVLLHVLEWNGFLVKRDEWWALSPEFERVFDHRRNNNRLSLLRIERWAVDDHLNVRGIVAALHGHCRPPEIDDRYVGALADAMLQGARASAPHIARIPELRDRSNLADVAGGSGGYAVLLCRLHKNLRATVYDRPKMLTHAASVVEEAGVGDRISLVPWNLRFEPLPQQHDCALLSHVLHLLDQPARADLFRRLRAVLPDDALLVVHDFVYQDPDPSLAASAVDWLSHGTGFVPTHDTLATELAAASFFVDRYIPIAATRTTLALARCG